MVIRAQLSGCGGIDPDEGAAVCALRESRCLPHPTILGSPLRSRQGVAHAREQPANAVFPGFCAIPQCQQARKEMAIRVDRATLVTASNTGTSYRHRI